MTNFGGRTTVVGLSLFVVFLMTGCASTPSGPNMFVLPVPPAAPTEYVIQPGDSLAIKFYYHGEQNQETTVRTDGKIVLQLVGEVHAAGLTPAQLSTQLAKLYSTNLRDPKIDVVIKQMGSQNRVVYVGGEVSKPGYVPYRPGLTAVQALMEAGGPLNTADLKECVLLQKVADKEYRPSKIDLLKVLEEGDTNADLPVNPADVIFVPKTGIARANVWMEQHVHKMLPIRPSMGYGF